MSSTLLIVILLVIVISDLPDEIRSRITIKITKQNPA